VIGQQQRRDADGVKQGAEQSRPQPGEQTCVSVAGLRRRQQTGCQIDGQRDGECGNRREADALYLHQVIVGDQEHAPAEAEERAKAQCWVVR
jgi:hypothetical protein